MAGLCSVVFEAALVAGLCSVLLAAALVADDGLLFGARLERVALAAAVGFLAAEAAGEALDEAVVFGVVGVLTGATETTDCSTISDCCGAGSADCC